ncbi:MAG: hypothetical protein V3T33_11385, partial [Myxococcota bacterium]
VCRVLPLLSAGHDLMEVRAGRNRELQVAPLQTSQTSQATPTRQARAGGESGAGEGRGRSRRRGGRRRSPRSPAVASEVESPAEPIEASPAKGAARRARSTPRFDEVSFFDLDDEGRGGASREPREEGRGRRGGRTRRGRRSERGNDESPSPRPDEEAVRVDEDGDGSDEGADADSLAPLVEDIPDFDEVSEPRYDDEEDVGEDSDPEQDAIALEREKRRMARMAKSAPEPEAVAPEPKPPRRRAAVVAHADRDSLLAAVLLARDIRLLEGFWVYPQNDLMSFFRGAATDLRDITPIHVVGFTPSPAREVIQAAALYRDRLQWYDHRDWPPEDLEGLREAIGREAVYLTPGAHSSLPAVLATCSRRSRFSDKLVDLAASRFSQHDFERWGRLWWWRLGQIAANPGERRTEVQALLSGRPSELAKEAAGVETPPPPEELAYVAGRDFRLVHFAGFSLVVVDLPLDMDLHLSARIARERYGASLSLAMVQGEGLIVLAGGEAGSRRSLDLPGLAEHLVAKLEWAEALADEDHVARFRIRNLAAHPERLEEVIGEIAMGGSILGG